MKTRDERERDYLARTRGGWGRARQGVFTPVLGQKVTLHDDGADAGGVMLRRRRCVVVRVNPLNSDRRKAVKHAAKRIGVGLAWQDETTVRVFGPTWASLKEFVLWASERPKQTPATKDFIRGNISRCRSDELRAELLGQLASVEVRERPILADWWFATNDANKAGGTMGTLAPTPREKGKDDAGDGCPWVAYLKAEQEAFRRAAEWVDTLGELPDDVASVLRQCAARWFEENTFPPASADELAEWADDNVEWED